MADTVPITAPACGRPAGPFTASSGGRFSTPQSKRKQATGFEAPGPGEKAPNELYVVIEITAYSAPVKYEVDKDTGLLMVDRFMNVAMNYPANYGFIPKTLAGDGDPVDVLVLTPHPIVAGSVIKCRAVAVLDTEDEKGTDAK